MSHPSSWDGGNCFASTPWRSSDSYKGANSATKATRRRTVVKTNFGIYHFPDDRTELPMMVRIISGNGVDLLQQLGVVVLQGVRKRSHVRQ